MSDIDFEELDRAVNSLIASAPGAAAATVPAQQPIMGNSSSDSATQPDNDAHAVFEPTNDDYRSFTSLVENSHSKTSFEPTTDSTTSSAHLADNTRPQPTVKRSADDSRPIVERPAPTHEARSLAGQRGSGRFMDVIHPSANMRSSTPVPDVQIVPPVNNMVPPDISPRSVPVIPSRQNGTFASEPEPLESPFIAGAVVEKRPLGAFATDPVQEHIEISPSGEVTEGPIKPLNESPTDEETTPLPDELGDDLLKIESGNVTPEAALSVSATHTAEPQILSQTSISQQYKEKPADFDKKASSIYDTNVYHKDPNASIKKKSGWMWVLWIIILLAVGVGAGAVTYFYVLPLL